MARDSIGAVLRWLVLCVLWAAGSAVAGPARELTLDARSAVVDAWPALTVLADADGQATLQDVMARRAEFAPPTVPRGNFGTRSDALWLHLPLHNASDAGDWVLQFDYALLQRIDVVLLRDGRELQRAVLGSQLPFAQRPLPTLTHALSLQLPPGERAELFVRVQTSTAMLLPIRSTSERQIARPSPLPP